MKTTKRILCIVLTLALLLSAAPLSIQADAAQPFKKTGTFYYASQDMQDYPATYFYDDGYFSQSSYTYQDSLATMSMCLAMSGFNSYRTPDDPEGYRIKSQNLQALLADCGFPQANFAQNEGYAAKPTADSIGVAASHKSITVNGKPYTLLAVSVRGGGYEIEWASNFTLGTEGDHQGFVEARDQVLAFLTDYIAQHKLTGNVKLWLTGYSRGAVTANMTAAALDAGYALGGNFLLAPEDIYAYCFECPQGTVAEDAADPLYQNIFNIVNPADFVTMVAPTNPAHYGFRRYGVDRFLPTALTYGDAYAALRDAMVQKYNALPSTEGYLVDDFRMKKLDPQRIFDDGLIVNNTDPRWDQSAFLTDVFSKLFTEVFHDRNQYVLAYQNDFRAVSTTLFRSEKQMKVFGEKLGDNLGNQLIRIAICLLLDRQGELTGILQDVVSDSLDDSGITDYSKQEIDDLTEMLVTLLISFGKRHPEMTITLISNLDSISSAHYPELCFAWLQSFDPNYASAGTDFSQATLDGIYRISGENRYETSIQAADSLLKLQGRAQFHTVVVASGSEFPDALAGSFLAAQKNAPILLVNAHTVDAAAAYIAKNLDANGMVYLLGGEAAVPPEMETALSGFYVKRLAGANRYETNLAILEEAGGAGQEVLICTGKSFADSLSASAVGKPILLVNKTLSDAQKAYLARSSGKYVIIGGESAVSAELAAELASFGTVERIGGADRYETSVLVARRFFTAPTSTVLAYAKKFPDGLCGGPLACSLGAPLILTAAGKESAAAAYAGENSISTGLIMGGQSLIPDQSAKEILTR